MTLWELEKSKITINRNDKYDQKIDRRNVTLRSPLNLDEKVLVLARRLKTKDAPGNLYKASNENMLFFNRDRIFTIHKKSQTKQWHIFIW